MPQRVSLSRCCGCRRGHALPVALSRALPEQVQHAWLEEAHQPIKQRQLFKFGEIADALARNPGRQEVDMAESARIAGNLVEWFNCGEFADEEVLASFDDPPHFRPLRPSLEDVQRQAEQDCRLDWRELILTRPALKTYLERTSLDGASRLLHEWFPDADRSRGKPPTAKRPTDAQLDEWMTRNVKPGAKRDPTILDCRQETGATVRAAIAAWTRIPADRRRRRGRPPEK
jgi:hypothetical protein